MPRIYISDLERAVIDRAMDWYVAKQAAQSNAGQPVNWENFNLAKLESALQELSAERAKLLLAYGRQI